MAQLSNGNCPPSEKGLLSPGVSKDVAADPAVDVALVGCGQDDQTLLFEREALAPGAFRVPVVGRRSGRLSQLAQVAGVVALWPIRAAEKTTIPAHPGNQPASAIWTAFDCPAAVAAMVGVTRPDRQASPTVLACTLSVLAQGEV